MTATQDPGAARDERIRAYFPALRRLALHVRRMVPGADLDELVGDGSVGLIRAVDTYDAERGASFERYMRQVVVGAMLNGLRKRDPVSERARRTLRDADRVAQDFAQHNGRMPTTRELEGRCRGFERARGAVHAYVPLSLDAPLPVGTVAADAGPDPADLAAEADASATLNAAIEALPPRERRLIVLHYHREVPLRGIGTCLSVSPQRASQLHLAALGRLRKRLLQSA